MKASGPVVLVGCGQARDRDETGLTDLDLHHRSILALVAPLEDLPQGAVLLRNDGKRLGPGLDELLADLLVRLARAEKGRVERLLPDLPRLEDGLEDRDASLARGRHRRRVNVLRPRLEEDLHVLHLLGDRVAQGRLVPDVVAGVGVGPSSEEKFDHLGLALVGGDPEGRDAVLVPGVDVGPSVDGGGDGLLIPRAHGGPELVAGLRLLVGRERRHRPAEHYDNRRLERIGHANSRVDYSQSFGGRTTGFM